MDTALLHQPATKHLQVPPPTRSRADEQIMELTLRVLAGGRFAHRIAWGRAGGVVLGEDRAGNRLAVEHTRLEETVPCRETDPGYRPLAEQLEAGLPASSSGRGYRLSLYPGFLPKLWRRYPEAVAAAFVPWAAATWPTLSVRPASYTFQLSIPLPGGKRPNVAVELEVSGRDGADGAVSVTTVLPDDPRRWRPVLERAFRARLPKLAKTDAGQRLWILEERTADSGAAILDLALAVAEQRRVWAQVDGLAIVKAFAFETEQVLGIDVWDVKAGEWRDSWTLEIVSNETALVAAPDSAVTPLLRQARAYVQAAKAPNTLRAYNADWRDFVAWCEQQRRPALPADPGTVALYLTDRSNTLKTSSLSRRLTAISRRHQALGLPSPAAMHHAHVSEVWKGIQRTNGTAQEGKQPLLTADIRRMLEDLPDTLQGLRDRALLLVGFAGGFRRSEVAALLVSDLKETEQGTVVRLRRSKTDPTAQGRSVALPYGSDPGTCPVRALRTWLAAAGIQEGPLFRAVDQFDLPEDGALHPDSIAYIVKRATARIGLNADEFAGHSLRAGLATQAAMNGAGELAIMKQTGHRSLATVRKYIREGSLFRDNAATKLGL